MPLLERRRKGQHPLGWGRNSVWAMGSSAHWLWGFIAKTFQMQGICFDRMGIGDKTQNFTATVLNRKDVNIAEGN